MNHKTLRTCIIVTSLLISSRQSQAGITNKAWQCTKILTGAIILWDNWSLLKAKKAGNQVMPPSITVIFSRTVIGLFLIEHGLKELKKKSQEPQHSEPTSN